MARLYTSPTTPIKVHCFPDYARDGEAFRVALAARTKAAALFDKYDLREVQELLSLTDCHWLLSNDDFTLPVDLPPGMIKQMKNFTHSNMIILSPFDPRAPLDYKVVHQIVRELTVGIYCFNQIPVVSLEPNYDQSTTCHLSPAYYDTKIGQILLNIDYTIKALWHGAYIPKEKRIRFAELWRSSMDVDSSGVPQTKKDVCAEFLTAGLMDIADDPCYRDIFAEHSKADPIYDPNSVEEENLFSQCSDSIVIKMTSFLTSAQQHENLFVLDGSHSLASVVRLTEDKLDLATYQRLQQKLSRQIAIVRKSLFRKTELCRDMAYLKLITFLVPLLIGLKKKMRIPNLSKMLPPLSEDKLKTEREMPPLLLGPQFSCKHFPYNENEYFHLHGGIEVDVGTPQLDEISEEMKEAFSTLQSLTTDYLRDLLSKDTTYIRDFPIPLSEIGGKSYHAVSIELESFYPQHGTVQWWEALNSSIKTLRAKRLPLTDIQLHEQFKETFGYQKAIQCKNVPFGLRASAERGLSAVFQSLSRRNSLSHLSVLDEEGFSLLHHAAAHNNSHIICQLAATGLNLNQTRSGRFTRTVMSGNEGQSNEGVGPTPLHLAAQCGSLDALNCLLALQADHTATDRRGWMPVHFAAFYGQVACVRALCRKDPALLEIQTSAEYHSSVLLLSAIAGSVETLDFLLSIGADWRKTDSHGNNVVQLAALYFHIDILKHLIQLNLEGLPVWKVLVGMLQSAENRRLEISIRCLEALCVDAAPYWKDIMEAGGVPALVELLRSGGLTLQCIATAVVCHLSENTQVSEALVQHGAVPVLIKLLGCQQAELQSRCAVILADLAGHNNQHQSLIADLGGVALVVKLLHSDLEDVLLNAVKCIRTLCVGSPGNQSAVAWSGGIPPLVELLTVESGALQEEACLTLAELARGHRENQDAICGAGAASPLVQILKRRKTSAQVKAANAIEAIANENSATQGSFLEISASEQLLRLLKVFQMDVREQGAVSLWALAGQTLKQQKAMAQRIGYHFTLDLLLSSSDKMQYVGCQAVIAFCKDSRVRQHILCRENVVPPLVRLLRGSRTSMRTLLSVIQALGTLCIGVAHTNNKTCQKAVADEGAIPALLAHLKLHESLQVAIQVAQTLACVLVGNQVLQTVFWEKEDFSHRFLLKLLQSQDKDTSLEAGYALTLFAYNNRAQQRAILHMGGVSLAEYEPYLSSVNELERAKAAFQIVVLAKVITDSDHVTLSARGITVLVELLQSEKPATIVLTAQLLSSLAHTRAGIPNATVSMGAVGHLTMHLHSEEEEVRTACATALGYLSFNPYAHRLLLMSCRNRPVIYELLMKNLAKDATISKVFTSEFKRQKTAGLPSLSLEINGGPPVPHHSYKGMSRRNSSEGPSVYRTRSSPASHLKKSKSANTKVHFRKSASHTSQESVRLDKGS